ncbi:MAG: PAS domain-containing protein [Firmicutes bacterium]|nr:PAS domain-containing protein [Bacillota bacterium]
MKTTRYQVTAAIKEAFDNLPSGVCYFDRNGLIVLCNRKMYALAFELMGKDLQLLSELQQALDRLPEGSSAVKEGELYILSDGTAWRITQKRLVDEDGTAYIQVFAADVTELRRNSRQLEENNRKLEEISLRLQQITQNAAAIAREEEILSMKMRVHDELGESLLALRTYCLNGFPKEKKEELLADWTQSIRLLQEGIETQESSDSFEELFSIAASVGIKICRSGSLPPDPQAQKLMTAAVRECVTNGVRHARATELYTAFIETPDTYQLHITNNGTPPKGVITEGGGLSSLRRRIENAGGAMKVLSSPGFELIISLPAAADRRKGILL